MQRGRGECCFSSKPYVACRYLFCTEAAAVTTTTTTAVCGVMDVQAHVAAGAGVEGEGGGMQTGRVCAVSGPSCQSLSAASCSGSMYSIARCNCSHHRSAQQCRIDRLLSLCCVLLHAAYTTGGQQDFPQPPGMMAGGGNMGPPMAPMGGAGMMNNNMGPAWGPDAMMAGAPAQLDVAYISSSSNTEQTEMPLFQNNCAIAMFCCQQQFPTAGAAAACLHASVAIFFLVARPILLATTCQHKNLLCC